jgi:dTDP-N-acetylfucosamine:lipid II N-acetylfucosaminyltransferase
MHTHHIFKGLSVNTTPHVIDIMKEYATLHGASIDQHQFHIYNYSGVEDRYISPDIRKIKNIFELYRFVKRNSSTNRIIIHGNPSAFLWELLLLTRAGQHVAWVSWGHGFRFESRGPLSRMHNYSIKHTIGKLHSISMNMHSDHEYVQNTYFASNIYEYGYSSAKHRNFLRSLEIIPEKSSKKERFSFLVGTNGSRANNHLEGLQALRSFRPEDIRVYCPLSYNITDPTYVEDVIAIGREYFGESFIPLTEMRSREEYNMFLLNDIDCLVHTSQKQQGLGTIYFLIAVGKKLFLKQGGDVKTSLERYNISLYGIEDLSLELVRTPIPIAVINKNRERLFTDVIKEDGIVNHWKFVFTNNIQPLPSSNEA